VLAFLRSLPGQAQSLVINGDLFDFWFEWGRVIPRRGFRILSALGDFKDAGGDILYVAGNHDCWGGDVLRDDIGIDYQTERWEGTLAGWRARVEHGDGLRDREDRRYRQLRAVLRHPLAIAAYKLLPPNLATRLAAGSSQASRTYLPASDKGAGLLSVAIGELAANRFIELIIYGHSHVAALERGANNTGVYANAGSWLNAPTYLAVTPERVELRHWTPDAPDGGVCLDAVDRVYKMRPSQAVQAP
jgi:UDP-2,3-diacylglucosamine hydrolase